MFEAAARAKKATEAGCALDEALVLMVCDRQNCTAGGPCQGRAFARPGAKMKHTNAKNSQGGGRVAATFQSFFKLPPSLIRRAHLATFDFTSQPDPGTKPFNKAGRFRPEWWS